MRKHGDTKIIVNRVSECFRIFCLAVGIEIGLRQIARYLPHHRSENASKTHPKSSHDKFKTASKTLSAKPSDYFDKFFPITFFLVFANAAYFSKGIDGSRSGRG